MESEVYKATKSVLLCGVGGQGTVLASRLIALIAMEEGMEAKGAETIGMAQRGGSVVSRVRTGKEIYSPLIPYGGVDMFIGFEPAEAARCLPYLKKSGCAVVSPIPIQPVTASLTGGGYTGPEMVEYLKHAADNPAVINVVSIEMTCGPPKVMNVALLGAAITSGPAGIPLEEMEAATKKRVPEKFKGMNMRALKLGVSASPMVR